MAEAVWNGSLRLSLVSCPISLSAATSNSPRIKLDLLSARTGNPVTEQFVDSKTGDVVASESLVKGYEFETSRYVTMTTEEFGKLGGGIGNIIDLEHFIRRDQIDLLHIDDVYYVHPEGHLAADTVDALRLAMQRSGRVALGHVRIGESQRPALIEPHRGGLMLSTLRTKGELVEPDFAERPESDISADMIEIAEAIISRRTADFDPATLRDGLQEELQQILQQKAKDAPPALSDERRPRLVPAPEVPPPPPAPEPSPEPETLAGAATAPPHVPDPEDAPLPEEPEPEESVAAVVVPPPEPPSIPEPAPEPEAVEASESAHAPAPVPEPELLPGLAAGKQDGPQDVGTEILLHIMGLGDRRYVEPGWAGNPGSRRQIEALSIRPRDGLAPSAIEFRVFAQEGRATAWVSNGNYAGTRGRNLPLTGFAVRPTGEVGERLEIAYEGSFFEGGVVGPKRNGELCVSPVADDPLEAVRVTIIDQGE
jgi:DNA end-binding protein Ku